MKRNRLVLRFALLSLILSLAITYARANQAPEPAKISPKRAPDANNLAPRISFEKTVCDLGDVGQGTKNTCEFKFTNTGRAMLKIGKIKRTCGCTVFELDRKEYAPGQKGTIRVSYIAGKSTALRQKHIYVPSNDKDNPKVKLTIKARVVQMVEAAPQKLQLSLRKGSAGMPDIRLVSKDGKPFSIKSFKSTNNGIVTDFDPNVSVPEFVLHPKVDIEKLKAGLRGYIDIQLTHPQCPSVRIPYEILAEFKATPTSIIVMKAKPQEVVTREITIVSNYDEDFEVESTSSKNGYIKVLSQEKLEKVYKFKVQVTPPLVNKRSLFSDTFYVGIKGKDKLAIGCRGFYSKRPTYAKKPDKSNKGPVKFRAEPQVIKIRDAEPGRPLIKEVWVFSSDNEDFQIESASSQKGTIKLLSQEKLGNRYKLKLKITPPPTKYRLKIFSDVLYVTIRSNKTKDQTIKLPITCRGSYSRRPRK